MQGFRGYSAVVTSLALALTASACGATVAPGPGDAAPTLTGSAAASSPPSGSCAAFLPDTPCATYASTAGSSGSSDLAWVAGGHLTARLESVSGSLHLTMTTPCGPLSAPAQISGSTLIIGAIAVGASGCTSEASARQQWVITFLQRTVAMTVASGTLKWTSGGDVLTFKAD